MFSVLSGLPDLFEEGDDVPPVEKADIAEDTYEALERSVQDEENTGHN